MPNYYGYFNICGIVNDPLLTVDLNPSTIGIGQGIWLLDAPWILAGKSNPITKDLDSLETWKYMHVQANITNPNIVLNIFDGGYDNNHVEFTGRTLFSYNYETNNATVTPVDHTMAVASLSAATFNNNNGGAGVWQGPLRNFDIGGGVSFLVSNMLL